MRQNQECSLKSSRFVEVTPTAPTQQNTFFLIKVEQSRDPYMLTVEQLSVALRKQSDCHPIPPQPPFLNPKTNDCAVVLWVKQVIQFQYLTAHGVHSRKVMLYDNT